MLNEVTSELQSNCQKSIEALRSELSRVRTGRATPSLLDNIKVPYYGAPSPLNQVATVAVADSRLLTITPWEKNLIPEIERAIQASGLGLTPSNDGKLVRLPIPPLTGERRKELGKQVKKIGEDYKIAIRGHRRDANDTLKLYKEEKEISEDDYHRGLKSVQDETNKYTSQVDVIVSEKEQEIMDF